MLTEFQINTIKDWVKPEIFMQCYGGNIAEWSEGLLHTLVTYNRPELELVSVVNTTSYINIDPAVVKKIDELHKMVLEFTKEVE